MYICICIYVYITNTFSLLLKLNYPILYYFFSILFYTMLVDWNRVRFLRIFDYFDALAPHTALPVAIRFGPSEAVQWVLQNSRVRT